MILRLDSWLTRGVFVEKGPNPVGEGSVGVGIIDPT